MPKTLLEQDGLRMETDGEGGLVVHFTTKGFQDRLFLGEEFAEAVAAEYHPEDRLSDMFRAQRRLQERVDPRAFSPVPATRAAYVKDMVLAASDELMEMLRRTPWKPWKKQQEWDEAGYRNEWVDLLHFVLNLALVAGITPQQAFAGYMHKNKVNHTRRSDGY